MTDLEVVPGKKFASPSRSGPDQGVIKVKTTTLNQSNERVQVSVGNLIVLHRPPSSPSGALLSLGWRLAP